MISKTDFELRLKKSLQELEPVAKSVTTKVVNESRAQEDGTVAVETKEQKSDIYMDEQMAAAIAKAVADALQEHNFSFLNSTLVPKVNTLIAGYNQLLVDLAAAMVPVTAQPITALPL